jgi:hypothetical protein
MGPPSNETDFCLVIVLFQTSAKPNYVNCVPKTSKIVRGRGRVMDTL